MHFTPAFLLAAIAALTQAGKFSLEGMPPGGYILSHDENGNQTTKAIDPSTYRHPGPPSAKLRRTDSALQKRAQLPSNLQISCNNYGSYDHGDIVTAKMDLFAWCDSGNSIAPGSGVAFVIGDAVYYACSNGGWNPCSSGEINQADDLMNAQCGLWSDVNLWIQDWAKTYGRSIAGHAC